MVSPSKTRAGFRIVTAGWVKALPAISARQIAIPEKRRVRIRRADQTEAAIGALHQPRPAGAERADRGLAEFFFELRKAAERLLDAVGELAARFAAAFGRQAVPIKRVVPHLRRVVEQSSLRLLHDRHQIHVLELGALDHVVGVGDVGLMMLAVVVLNGLRADMRCQGILGPRQGRQLDRHGCTSFLGWAIGSPNA